MAYMRGVADTSRRQVELIFHRDEQGFECDGAGLDRGRVGLTTSVP
jgi:hypothetical protein